METEDDGFISGEESVESVSVESVRVRSRLAEDHLRREETRRVRFVPGVGSSERKERNERDR